VPTSLEAIAFFGICRIAEASLSEEPSAVIPHAGIRAGGGRATALPTATCAKLTWCFLQGASPCGREAGLANHPKRVLQLLGGESGRPPSGSGRHRSSPSGRACAKRRGSERVVTPGQPLGFPRGSRAVVVIAVRAAWRLLPLPASAAASGSGLARRGASGGCTAGVSLALAGKTSGWSSGRSVGGVQLNAPLASS